VSNDSGPLLVDVVSALVSIAALSAFLRVWRPAKILARRHRCRNSASRGRAPACGRRCHTRPHIRECGPAYPFFGTLLGWLGTALTDTDAASNVLFGSLQKITAQLTSE
jgi:L-lactate permease